MTTVELVRIKISNKPNKITNMSEIRSKYQILYWWNFGLYGFHRMTYSLVVNSWVY